jgi:hypothetical protein
MHLPRSYVEKNWLPSLGEKLGKIHFREPPPGTGHAEYDLESQLCKIHYDKVNPYQDLLGHLIEDSPQTLVGVSAGVLVGSIVYLKTRNAIEALLSAFVFGVLSYGIAKLLFEVK